MSTSSLSPQGNDFDFTSSFEEQDENRGERNWYGVEELPAEHLTDFAFEDRLLAGIDGNNDPSSKLIADHELAEDDDMGEADDWYHANLSDEAKERLASETAAEQLEEELKAADSYMPAFSSNRERFNSYGLSRDDEFLKLKRREVNQKSHKPAKFRIDGKRARKDSPRWSIRHSQVAMSDWYYLELQEYAAADFLDDHEQFMAEVEDEASYQEIVAWMDENVWESLSDGWLFDPVTNSKLVGEVWERHLFPERFEPIRSHRFSDWGDWIDYDERDRYDDDRHLDGLDLEDLLDDGPTLEEWAELDRIAMEQLLEEADRFSPSFVGSRRTMLHYHLSEPRRGKLKRKFSKSGSFLYRQTGAPRRAMYT